MARHEDFHNTFWGHPDVEELSADATLLFIWSWTNPRCGMAGIYEVGRRAMAECKVPIERLDSALEELAAAGKLFYQDGVLLIAKRVARLRTKSPQVAKSVVKDLLQIPDGHPLRGVWLHRYGRDSWLKAALSEAHVNLGRTSTEAHGNPHRHRDNLSLTHSSLEPHQGLLNSGSDSDSGRDGSQGAKAVDARKSKRVDPNALPADFPAELVPVAEQVLAKLERLQAERGGNEPTLRGVGLAIINHSNRDHVAVAGDLEHWATVGRGQARAIHDWPKQYGNFLAKATPGTPTRTGLTAAERREQRLAALDRPRAGAAIS